MLHQIIKYACKGFHKSGASCLAVSCQVLKINSSSIYGDQKCSYGSYCSSSNQNSKYVSNLKSKQFFRYPASRKMSTSSSTADLDDVLFEEVDCKGVITLNRPKALNALTESMVLKMAAKMLEWESEKKLVIIKGAGDKSFCAGGDVVTLTAKELINDPNQTSFYRHEYTLNNIIGTYRIPYVAFVTGIVMGGGAGVSMNGRYRIASDKSLFAMPETAIGLFPDVGGSHFLPRLGGGLGMFLALTGHRLRGGDLVRAGLATHFCPSDKLNDLQAALLALPHKTKPEHVRALLDAFHKHDLEFSLAPHLKDIKECFTAPTLDAILDKLGKSPSEFCRNQLALIEKMCPTSVAISHEQLKRGVTMTLQQCLQMEFRMVNQVLKGNEFHEGVRALLVDRDNQPKWTPATLKEVQPEAVQAYFAPLPEKLELVLRT